MIKRILISSVLLTSILNAEYIMKASKVNVNEFVKQEEANTPQVETFETSGDYGNIALIGTNGLTTSNYTASETYYVDSPAAAFDGYKGFVGYNSQQIYSDVGDLQTRGSWYAPDTNGPYWLQVDLGKTASIDSFKITAIYSTSQTT